MRRTIARLLRRAAAGIDKPLTVRSAVYVNIDGRELGRAVLAEARRRRNELGGL